MRKSADVAFPKCSKANWLADLTMVLVFTSKNSSFNLKDTYRLSSTKRVQKLSQVYLFFPASNIRAFV